jgi:hypothetical protein
MEKQSTQLCWYCKRNLSDPEYLNIEENTSTNTEIKGIYKKTTTTKKQWKVVRCKECYEVHNIGENLKGYIFLVLYILSYVLLCIYIDAKEPWLKYVLMIFFALFPTFLVLYIIYFTIGYYNAYKYKTKPKWARGGDVL